MNEPNSGVNRESTRGANPEGVSEFKSKGGLMRIYKAFTYTLAGLQTAWRHEHAFRQELILAIIGVIVALVLPVSPYERLLMIGVLFLVLIVELLNSAIEAVVDRVSLERHPLSKNAKDLGSAAVFFALALVVLTWGTVLYQHYLA